MNKRKFIVTTFILLAIAFILSGCTAQPLQDQKQEVSLSTEESSNQESSDTQEEKVILVETPYGNLSYPYTFEEILTWENEDDADVVRYVFYAIVDDERIAVFDISFTDQALGNANFLGEIKNDDGTAVNVYFTAYDEIVIDGMTDDQKNIVYTAQETVNDVISSLYNISSFNPA